MTTKTNDPKQLKTSSDLWGKAHLQSMKINFTNASDSNE